MPARSLASVSHAASWIGIFSAKLCVKRMAGPAVSVNKSERLRNRSVRDYRFKKNKVKKKPKTIQSQGDDEEKLSTSGYSSLSLLSFFQHQGFFFREHWRHPSTFLTTSQVSAGDTGKNCVAITTNQSWHQLNFDVAASVWWEGERRGWSRGGGGE